MTDEIAQRILAKTEVVDGCWLFRGAHERGGYGQVRIKGVTRYTHRVMYEIFVGAIPDGLQIDHTCRNRACCNPQHLEAVTPLVNAARTLAGKRGENRATIERAKTHCPHGHPYTPENTRRNAKGHRWCRTCQRNRYQPKEISA